MPSFHKLNMFRNCKTLFASFCVCRKLKTFTEYRSTHARRSFEEHRRHHYYIVWSGKNSVCIDSRHYRHSGKRSTIILEKWRISCYNGRNVCVNKATKLKGNRKYTVSINSRTFNISLRSLALLTLADLWSDIFNVLLHLEISGDHVSNSKISNRIERLSHWQRHPSHRVCGCQP